ncbi:protein SYM1-like isoform X2 [Canna indica]|uniref:Protein SYM1-like isoform X2 n=1 Tax=Canna indica TaxID=4628 RepID=A0AAQ3L301_9LILI|nr:protein SYM1-like isoform X2 [Canna indica]
MSGSFLRSGGRRAQGLFLRHLRSPPIFGELSKQSSNPARSYVRSHVLFSKLKESSSSGLSSASSSLCSTPLSSATTAASYSSIRTGFVSWYLGMIETRPVLTKSLTASAIFTAADVASQLITMSPSDSFDFIRTLRMAGYGVVLSGPSLHFWFNFVSGVLPKRDVLTTIKKMALGQVVYGPIMTSVFFSVNAGLQGESGAEIFARLKRDLIPTLKSGLVYWPMCDFITFKFIPVRLQPLVSNSFSFLWTIYLTYMASLEKANMKKISVD